MCTHLKEKRCLKCLSPSYMVESSEAREILFQKLLEKLGSDKKIIPPIACNAKMEYSWFFSTVVKKNNDEFLSCKKEGDRLDVYLWRYIAAKSQFSRLRNVFSIDLRKLFLKQRFDICLLQVSSWHRKIYVYKVYSLLNISILLLKLFSDYDSLSTMTHTDIITKMYIQRMKWIIKNEQ